MHTWKRVQFAIIRASDQLDQTITVPSPIAETISNHMTASPKRSYDVAQGKDQRVFDVFLFFNYITTLCI